MNLNELYTQIITENSRSKENRHPVEGATHSLEGVNPSCGDDITLQLRVKDGKIEDAGFIGSGCAISQASASLMIDLVKGRTVEDAHRLISLYFQMIKGKITPEELDDLEDVAALQGIAHVPARVKCAVLAWHTLEEAPDGEGKTDKVTTEEDTSRYISVPGCFGILPLLFVRPSPVGEAILRFTFLHIFSPSTFLFPSSVVQYTNI